MLSLLSIEPVWLSSILLVSLMTIIAMAGPILVWWRVSLHQLRLNNEVSGFKFAPVITRGATVLAKALHQLDMVTQARRMRLVPAPGTTPRVLWLVLSSGAILTIGFTLFFGTENLRAQVAMTVIPSFLIVSGLLMITPSR